MSPKTRLERPPARDARRGERDGLEGEDVIPGANIIRGSLRATIDKVVAIANGATVPDKSSEPR